MIGIRSTLFLSLSLILFLHPLPHHNRPDQAARDMGAPLSAGTDAAEAVSGRR
jgi:hypothetical protein